MTSLLHGANIVHDVGFMDAGLQGSLQMMAICNEILGFLRATTAGVVVNDETLALDVIEELGPTGSYLGHEHTTAHYKEAVLLQADRQEPLLRLAEDAARTTMEATRRQDGG